MTITYDQFAIAQLAYSSRKHGKNMAASVNNVQSLVCWFTSENDETDIATHALFNPGDTEENMPHATNFNEAGVKNYQDLPDGLEAFDRTLFNGYYDSIIESLEASNPAMVTCAHVCASKWGSKPTPELVNTVLHNFSHYANLPVGGSENVMVSMPETVTPKPEPKPQGTESEQEAKVDSAINAQTSQLDKEVRAEKPNKGDILDMIGKIRIHLSELEDLVNNA